MVQALNQPFEGAVRRRGEGLRSASLSGPLAAARALQSLAEDFDVSPSFALAHPYSPLGIVQIDADRCTGCGACAQACPTGALAFQQEDAVSLTFDPNLCTGCGQCSGWCPEHIMRIDRVTDLQRLSGGRIPLYEDQEVRCEVCGSVIGPAAMLWRIANILSPMGGANEATISTITRLCPSCRLTGVR